MDKFFSCKFDKKNFNHRYDDFMRRSFIVQCSLAGLTHAGLSRAQEVPIIAKSLGVNERTIRRWINNEATPHPSAVRLLFAFYVGVPISDRWAGWYFNGEYLVSPTGFSVNQDVEKTVFHLKSEIVKLRSQLKTANLKKQAPVNHQSGAVRAAIKSLMFAFGLTNNDL